MAARVGQRMTAVLLAGVTGYGLVALFALHGAPDLALTQALVETMTLVVFVLVLRRLPPKIAEHNRPMHRRRRALIGTLVGVVMGTIGMIALGARQAPSISAELPRLSVEQGHGNNIVNVMLVDIRAWDTMGEISVLIVVATGVASLLFVSGRTADVPRVQGSRTLRSPGEPPPRRARPDRVERGQRRDPSVLARRRRHPRAGQPLDPDRGARAAAVPPRDHRVDLPALRRPQRSRRRVRRRPARRPRARGALPRRRPLRAR